MIKLLPMPILVQSLGKKMRVNVFYPSLVIDIPGITFRASLIKLDVQYLDMLLGMDWLTKHRRIRDCAQRSVTLFILEGKIVEYVNTSMLKKRHVLNSLKAVTLEDVPIVQEYSDVFLEEILGLPSDQEIEFAILLVPETTHISKRSYCVLANDLEELKKQIEDLEGKGYIFPSTSLWGAPMLFVKKEW